MVDRNQQPRLVDEPEECYIRLKLTRGGPFVAARIYRCLGMLVGEINGASGSIFQIWHGGEFIDETEYHRMLAAPPDDPYAIVEPRFRATPF